MPSPPKPWEQAAAGNAGGGGQFSAAAPSANAPVPSSTGSAPTLPARSLATGYAPTATSTAVGHPAGTATGMGVRPGYGTGYSAHSTPYSRFGASRYGGMYGNSYGSGYGSGYGSTYGSGYGSGYGTYGNAYSSYGGYGGGLYGPRPGMFGATAGDPNDPTFTNRMEQGTANTFHMLESVVSAFGGLAQMLESTYMATHSSFFAMIGVAEQFGHLRSYLGQVLSVFTLVRLLRRLGYWILGRTPPVDARGINVHEFEAHQQRAISAAGSEGSTASRRPLYLFLAAIIGLPWLISRLARAAEQRRQEQQQQDQQHNGTGNPSTVQPSDLEFARALYDFQGDQAAELTLRRGDLIAILSRHDAHGQPTQWWRGRLRDGRVGLFPANYVEILEKRSHPHPPAAPTTPSSGHDYNGQGGGGGSAINPNEFVA